MKSLLLGDADNCTRDLHRDCLHARLQLTWRPHDLRHTLPSWLVQGGVPLHAVRDLLSHASITQTERYAHLAPNPDRQSAQALDAARRSAPRIHLLDR